jgi:hypothetical protein
LLNNRAGQKFSKSVNTRGMLAAGLMGLTIGFLGGVADGLVLSNLGKSGAIMPEIAPSVLVLVPLGCLGGTGLAALVAVLGKINLQAHRIVVRSFPYLWIGLLFIYLAVSYYHGLAGFYMAYVRCGLAALLVGIPSYIGLRIMWLWLNKARPKVMIFVALLVGACAALLEIAVFGTGFWSW